jgi:MerR family redox-sensitive transcriptional activator SoxR
MSLPVILVVEVNFKSRENRMHTRDLLTVGEVARRSGFATSAVRYYDRIGLITSTRTAGDQRRYERGVLRRLAFIRAAANVGLTLDEVAESLALLPSSRTPTKADWARLSRGWRERLNEQIAALENLRDGLETCIGCGCLSLRKCAFSNPDDGMATLGPGAAYFPRRLRVPQPGQDG